MKVIYKFYNANRNCWILGWWKERKEGANFAKFSFSWWSDEIFFKLSLLHVLLLWIGLLVSNIYILFFLEKAGMQYIFLFILLLVSSHFDKELSLIHIGAQVYPSRSLVIVLVRGPSVALSLNISETTLRIFLIFCMKFVHHNGTKVTEPDFWKKSWGS